VIVIKVHIHRGCPLLWIDASDRSAHPEKIDPAIAGSTLDGHGESIEEATSRLPSEVGPLVAELLKTKDQRIDREGWWASIHQRDGVDVPLTLNKANQLAKKLSKGQRPAGDDD
jgi:hypothetical protein